MWFITLIVLALAAFLVIKAVKAQSDRKSKETSSSPADGLQGQLKRDTASQTVTEPRTAANDAGQIETASAESPQKDLQTPAAGSAPAAEHQQDELREIREMIKVLNLAEPDSARLGISAEQFQALRTEASAEADAAAMPSRETRADIADRLRRMLA